MKKSILNRSRLIELVKKNSDNQIASEIYYEIELASIDYIRNIIGKANAEKVGKSRITNDDIVPVILAGKKDNKTDVKCKRCHGLKDENLKFGFDLQDHIINEAKIAITSLNRGKKYVK